MSFEFSKKAITEAFDRVYLFKENDNCQCDEVYNCCPSTTNTPCK